MFRRFCQILNHIHCLVGKDRAKNESLGYENHSRLKSILVWALHVSFNSQKQRMVLVIIAKCRYKSEYIYDINSLIHEYR